MDAFINYYHVLGVLPSAEQLVIVAAYRALAGRYHPDRWRGNPEEANQRMAKINAAYEVLKDPVGRAEYDKKMASFSGNFDENSELVDDDLELYLHDFESRWEVAVDIFPDLVDLRKRLERISSRLAFSFVLLVLEEKIFDKRSEVAQFLEEEFLNIYFGKNEKIRDFVRFLIGEGNKKAIKMVSKYTNVLGDSADPDLIIEKIIKNYVANTHEYNINCGTNLLSRIFRDDLLAALELARVNDLYVMDGWSGFVNPGAYKIYKKNAHDAKNLGELLFVAKNAKEFLTYIKYSIQIGRFGKYK